MHYLTSFLFLSISFFVSVFALSNILLPLFYILPRLQKEKRNKNIVKKVPIMMLAWAPISWTIILSLAIYFSLKYYPNHTTDIYIGIGLSVFGLARRIGGKNSDMDDDFKRTFKEYLKNDEEIEKPVSQEKHLSPNQKKSALLSAYRKVEKEKEQYTPQKITDIIFKLDKYIEHMQALDKNAPKYLDSLTNYIDNYFRNTQVDELELKKMTVEMVDEMYCKISRLTIRDIHTNAYFGIVVQNLFFELTQKNIRAFFILDNSIRDDRFKGVIELFSAGHFSTIHPYEIAPHYYGENYTPVPNKPFALAQQLINDSIHSKKNIFYLEKDDSVNYLNEVLAIAEEVQNDYICIFRNQAPDSGTPANWLLGSFGDYLKNKK